MNKTSFLKKTFFTFLIVLIVLIVCELTLRAAGWGILFIQDQKNQQSFNEKNDYTILCVGESTTYLGGENAYPQQLEEILNHTKLDKSFHVINKGIPGVNSDYILNHLEQWIGQYQPDILIVMLGVNDPHQAVERRKKQSLNKSWKFFKDLRINKVFSWLKLNLSRSAKNDVILHRVADQDALENAVLTKPEDQAKPKNFHEIALDQIRQKPVSFRQLYMLAYSFETKGKFQDAINIYKHLLTDDLPHELKRWLIKRTGNCLIKTKQFGELMVYVQEKFKNNAFDLEVSEWLPEIYQDKNGAKALIKTIESLLQHKPKSIPLHDILAAGYAALGESEPSAQYLSKARQLRLAHYNPMTTKNYVRLSKIVQEKNLKSIFVQYPLRSVDILKNMFDNQHAFKSIYFVDNEQIFQEAVLKEGYNAYFNDRFAGDFGHCTPRGNRLLAQNIANFILKNFLDINDKIQMANDK